MTIDREKVKEEALQEVLKDKTEELKIHIKAKLREIDKAREVLQRLEDELDELVDG